MTRELEPLFHRDNIDAEVSVYTKLIADLLKLKLKANKTIIVIAIDEVKQKSLRSAEIVIVKIMD